MSVWKFMSIWFSRELLLFSFERLDMLCAWIRHRSENLWPFWISRELPLFNLEHLDILCNLIGHSSEKLWRFKFLESFCCSISSVSIYYITESDLRVKSDDHLNFSSASIVQFQASRYIIFQNRTSVWKFMTNLNFSRASVVQFRASLYIISPNLTSELKVMTDWISREFMLFNYESLGIRCPRIGHPCEKLWQFEFL